MSTGIRISGAGRADHRHGPRTGRGLAGRPRGLRRGRRGAGQKLSALIWEGDIETLTLTENAQPALMATSMAVMRALEAEGVGDDGGGLCRGPFAGRILGAGRAGAIGLADTARLLRAARRRRCRRRCRRARARWRRCSASDFEQVRRSRKQAADGEVCDVANDNDPAQVVISGHAAAMERAVEIAKGQGRKRAMMLPVSAPFHCALMAPAAARMAAALAETPPQALPCRFTPTSPPPP